MGSSEDQAKIAKRKWKPKFSLRTLLLLPVLVGLFFLLGQLTRSYGKAHMKEWASENRFGGVLKQASHWNAFTDGLKQTTWVTRVAFGLLAQSAVWRLEQQAPEEIHRNNETEFRRKRRRASRRCSRRGFDGLKVTDGDDGPAAEVAVESCPLCPKCRSSLIPNRIQDKPNWAQVMSSPHRPAWYQRL